MTCSDWISIICASISLIVTIVIAFLQLWQSRRMERFERRQDERDEQRHAEGVKSQAVSFISKHYADRGLIPLCAMAAMHNDLYYYSREMYREFCCMTHETQNRVLEYCGLDLCWECMDQWNLSLFGAGIRRQKQMLRETSLLHQQKGIRRFQK